MPPGLWARRSAIVRRLERTGGCNSEALDLLNNLRELLAARERRLARVLAWPSWGLRARARQQAEFCLMIAVHAPRAAMLLRLRREV
jgi:hypothetical protein